MSGGCDYLKLAELSEGAYDDTAIVYWMQLNIKPSSQLKTHHHRQDALQ